MSWGVPYGLSTKGAYPPQGAWVARVRCTSRHYPIAAVCFFSGLGPMSHSALLFTTVPVYQSLGDAPVTQRSTPLRLIGIAAVLCALAIGLCLGPSGGHIQRWIFPQVQMRSPTTLVPWSTVGSGAARYGPLLHGA